VYRWIPQGEELVDAGAQNGEHNAQHPHAQSIDRHCWIIGLRDDSPDWGLSVCGI
jgi:hypothetical protein